MQQIEPCAQILLGIRFSVAFPYQFYPTERSEVHVSSRISSVLALGKLVFGYFHSFRSSKSRPFISTRLPLFSLRCFPFIQLLKHPLVAELIALTRSVADARGRFLKGPSLLTHRSMSNRVKTPRLTMPCNCDSATDRSSSQQLFIHGCSLSYDT
jgi:hypothetical protein